MTEEKKTTPSKAERLESQLKQRITRRQAVKVGGIAAVGLIFAKPIINTLRPKPAWAQVSPGPGPGPIGPGPVTPSTLSSVANESHEELNGFLNVNPLGGSVLFVNELRRTAAFDTIKAIIEFDISTLSGIVTSAVLALTDSSFNTGLPFPIDVYGYTATADGIVTVADFTGGIIAATVPSYNGGVLSVNVTSFLSPMILPGGTTYVGFRLEHSAPIPPPTPESSVAATFVKTASTLTIS